MNTASSRSLGETRQREETAAAVAIQGPLALCARLLFLDCVVNTPPDAGAKPSAGSSVNRAVLGVAGGWLALITSAAEAPDRSR